MATRKTYDNLIVKEVRNQALGDILEILKETNTSKLFSDRKYQMLLKLANTVLPRVQELGGINGEPIRIQGVEVSVRKS